MTDRTASPESDKSQCRVGTRNILLTLMYDGSGYRGWQVQPNGVTVQQRVEEAIERLTGETLRVYSASRTDTGVHALAQRAGFRTRCSIPVTGIRRGLQRYLPEDIVVIEAREVSQELHATFSVVSKTYCYVLHDGDFCPPFLRSYVSHSRMRLTASIMNAAAQHLRGTHDFRCFETEYPNKRTSVRTVLDVHVRREASWAPWPLATTSAGTPASSDDARPHEDRGRPFLLFEITADGFLYNMVRAIVGTLIDVGRGRRAPEYLAEVVASQDRSLAGNTAPPHGLYLVRVDYPIELLSPG
jgi:tRNA pseudouridine38-40 synthase